MDEFILAGTRVLAGERKKIDIEIAKLYDYSNVSLSVEVIRGKESGPCLFVSAAMHGDEINGIEILRRLLKVKDLKKIKGTLIIIPVVNIYGFNNKSRYLPDRRDLNRSFPGSSSGSLAARLADTFLDEIVEKCDYGIDLHSAAIYRSNYPQIRTSLNDAETKRLALAFGAPVVIDSKIREGSLREATLKRNIKLLIYEAGEALRFDEKGIKSGLAGVLSVMKEIGMLTELPFKRRTKKDVFVTNSSYWIRATTSGILSSTKNLGFHVKGNEILAKISDPFGKHLTRVTATKAGIIIGKVEMPLVNEGDALFHIACFDDLAAVEASFDSYDDFVDNQIEIIS